MKKIIALFLALCLLLSLCACGQKSEDTEEETGRRRHGSQESSRESGSREEKQEDQTDWNWSFGGKGKEQTPVSPAETEQPAATSAPEPPAATPAPAQAGPTAELPADLPWTREGDLSYAAYLLEDSYGDTHCFLILRSETDTLKRVTVDLSAMDAKGQVLDTNYYNSYVLGPGDVTGGWITFYGVTDVASVACEFRNESASGYQPILSKLAVSTVETSDGLIISVRNTADYAVQYLGGYILFFDAAGKLLDYDSCYFTDINGELRPGDTMGEKCYYYSEEGKDYDHFCYVLSGLANGKTTALDPRVSVADLEIEQYGEVFYGDSYWYVVVKNKSAYDIGISAHALAYNGSGKLVGASESTISCVGAGQTSLLRYYFSATEEVERVEQLFSFDLDNTVYTDVLGDLDASVTTNGKAVTVSVTNRGSAAADFLQAYVLLFDANGSFLECVSTYLVDSDYELKPGATITEEIYANRSFAYAELVLVGSHYNW